MDKQQEQLETLQEIRSMMERSSRFLSLSGLSGVIAGIAAIAGVAAYYMYFGLSFRNPWYLNFIAGNDSPLLYQFIVIDAAIVLTVSLLASALMTRRNALRNERPVWDSVARRLFMNAAIPLVAGGIYCLTLLIGHHVELVAPATLIFYGLALLNASKYTLDDVRYLGVLEIMTGLIGSLVTDYGLLFWAFGFGVLHIIYGLKVYLKYEK